MHPALNKRFNRAYAALSKNAPGKSVRAVAYKLNSKHYSERKLQEFHRHLAGVDAPVVQQEQGVILLRNDLMGCSLGHDISKGTLLYHKKQKHYVHINEREYPSLEKSSEKLLRNIIGDNDGSWVKTFSSSRVAMGQNFEKPLAVNRNYRFSRKLNGRVVRGRHTYASITLDARGEASSFTLVDPVLEEVPMKTTLSRTKAQHRLQKIIKQKENIKHKGRLVPVHRCRANKAFPTYCLEKRNDGEYLIPSVSVSTENILKNGESVHEIVDVSLDPDSPDVLFHDR